MRTRRMAQWAGLAAWIALAVPAATSAQRRPDGPPPDRAQIEQRIRAQMGRMMQERLGLDEEQAERLSEVVRSFDEQRRDIGRRELEARRRAGELTGTDGNDAEARELLELQAELRMQEAELFRAEQRALLDVLSPAQVLELQDLRQDIGDRIRALRGRGGPGSSRFRGRGPGPDGRIGAFPMDRGRPPLL